MKKITKCALAVAVAMFSNSITKAQVTSLGNTGGGTDYLGWDNAQAFPVLVEHKGAYPINFSTNGSQRATILANGNFGVGTTAPSAYMHSLGTTEQFRYGYDASNYVTHTVNSSGGTTIAGAGSSSYITAIGGNQVGSQLSVQSTSANGTSTGVGVRVLVGNNGGTEAISVLNNGRVV